jgi:predicted PurR-regulated permease PerM
VPDRPALRLPLPVTVAIVLMGALSAIVMLRAGRSVLIPLTVALMLAYALAPMVGWLLRLRVPRWLAVSLVMATLAVLTLAGALRLQPEVSSLIEDLPRAARLVREAIESGGIAGATIENLRRASSELGGGAPAPTPPAPAASMGSLDLLRWGTAEILAFGGHALVVFFLVFFMLLSGDLFRSKVLKIASLLGYRRVTLDVLDSIERDIKRYLLARVLTTAIVTALTWAALATLGLRHALVWAIAAGVANWIPYLGPVLISGGLFIVGLVEFGTMSGALLASGSALAVTSLEGWLIDPPLMGRIERMNTVAVLVGLMFWTFVWGAWGTLLAVPMLAVMKAVCDRVDGLKPVGALLGR